MTERGSRRLFRSGAPGPLSAVLLAAGLALLAAAGCATLPPGEPAAPAPQAPPAGKALAPRFIRVSVFVTEAVSNRPVEGADVLIGNVQLLPTLLPEEYGENREGLYDTDELEGGTYHFRARRAGYRTLAGRLLVPPVPERIGGHDPPVVLELEDVRESAEAAPSLQVMVLWQKYYRGPGQGQQAPHPPTVKPPGRSPHSTVTHPLGEPPPAPPPAPPQPGQ